MSPCELVVFDCDGVLVDSEPLASRAYVNVFTKHGKPITGDVITPCVGMKQTDILEKIYQMTGQKLPEGKEEDLWIELRGLFQNELQPTRHLKDFLRSLNKRKCVASSSSMERIEMSLELTGIQHYFSDAIFSSSMVKRGKPAPDLFLFAAEKMGVDPQKCVLIEDSPFGVQGGVAAGMTVLGYTGGGHTHAGHSEKLKNAGALDIFDSWDLMIHSPYFA